MRFHCVCDVTVQGSGSWIKILRKLLLMADAQSFYIMSSQAKAWKIFEVRSV